MSACMPLQGKFIWKWLFDKSFCIYAHTCHVDALSIELFNSSASFLLLTCTCKYYSAPCCSDFNSPNIISMVYMHTNEYYANMLAGAMLAKYSYFIQHTFIYSYIPHILGEMPPLMITFSQMLRTNACEHEIFYIGTRMHAYIQTYMRFAQRTAATICIYTNTWYNNRPRACTTIYIYIYIYIYIHTHTYIHAHTDTSTSCHQANIIFAILAHILQNITNTYLQRRFFKM